MTAFSALPQGRWTPEEDLRLHDLVEQKGAKWKEIGPLLERAPGGHTLKVAESLCGRAGRTHQHQVNARGTKAAIHCDAQLHQPAYEPASGHIICLDLWVCSGRGFRWLRAVWLGAAASCRDRWKEVRLGESQRKGKWDEEETARLRQLVEEYIERRQVRLLDW